MPATRVAETVESVLKHYDELGGLNTDGHYPGSFVTAEPGRVRIVRLPE